MILIKSIYTTKNDKNDNKARLVFDIEEDNISKQVWFEVDEEYGKYLCFERCDAILIGLLNYAMRKGQDIVSNIPITDELLFNLTEYLIPALSISDKNLFKINLKAPIAPAIDNAGAVGTGLSCGIDSFHSVLKTINSPYPKCKLTHLCINNVGAFNECYEHAGIEEVKKYRFEQSRKVARELNLPIIVSDSNFWIEFYQEHLKTHTYSSVFAVLCLQKLWQTYFYASAGRVFKGFDLKDNSNNPSDYYEFLSYYCFSNSKFKIYTEGAVLSRLQKTKDIADNKIVQKYLHVCRREKVNCSICTKCRRTMLALDVLGKLQYYGEVFDLDYYYKHKNEYLYWLCLEHLNKDVTNEPTYQMIKNKIPLMIKILAFLAKHGILSFIGKYIKIDIFGIKIKFKKQ